MPAVATPERRTIELPQEDTNVFLDQPWQVVVHDDPVNLMSYVTHVLRKIFGYQEDKARQLMLLVHKTGRAIAWTGARERAEHYVRELHAHQLLATLEKAGD
jgi:ATP-dependent Clp protease adaptor protein ClpS